MKNLTLRNIATACNGIYFGSGVQADTEITAVVTDSRKIVPGCLFVAIRGERVDGHDFIEQAYADGAFCVLTEKNIVSRKPYIRVESSLKAIQDIAYFYRKSLNVKVVGITGSVGKTSTKEMIASVLSQKYKVLKTQGNFNNGLGLPLTIFRLTPEDEVAVLEMGISDFGEMKVLSRIARPDVCVFTNIGMCHLEQLHNRDGILKAKTEMFEYMSKDGEVILNGDDDKLSTIPEVNGKKPHRYGISKRNDVFLKESENLGLKGTRCIISTPEGEINALIHIPGKHMLYNAMAGVEAGLIFGLNAEEIKRGIESLEPINGRNNIIETESLTIIDDCYNANPVSMRASLDVLSNALTRKVCILGDMGELGDEEEQMHYDIGRYAAESEADIAVFIGKLANHMNEGFMEIAHQQKCIHFDTVEDFEKKASDIICKGDTVLVKASHFMHFENIVAFLKEYNA